MFAKANNIVLIFGEVLPVWGWALLMPVDRSIVKKTKSCIHLCLFIEKKSIIHLLQVRYMALCVRANLISSFRKISLNVLCFLGLSRLYDLRPIPVHLILSARFLSKEK